MASATSEGTRVRYLDSSAIVKLVVREGETDALTEYLRGAELVSSEVADVEVPRVCYDRRLAAALQAGNLRVHAPGVGA